jgi:pyruvate dehydrogenase E1 component
MLHPGEAPKVPYVAQCLRDAPGVFVAASDYVKALPDSIDRWLPRPMLALGTDGFGRSESRAGLRDFFEVDAKHIAFGTLAELLREKKIDAAVVKKAMQELQIRPEKLSPSNT